MHFIVAPFTFVLLAVRPVIFSITTDLILLELSFVVRSVSESQFTLAFFLAIYVIALIFGTIWPWLHAEAVLLVVDPISVIISAVGMWVSAFSVCLVIDPLSFINVSIGMNKLALPVRFVCFPVTLIARTIRPHLVSEAISDSIVPLSGVDSAIFKCYGTSGYSTFCINFFTVLDTISSFANSLSKVLIVIILLLKVFIHLTILVFVLNKLIIIECLYLGRIISTSITIASAISHSFEVLFN